MLRGELDPFDELTEIWHETKVTETSSVLKRQSFSGRRPSHGEMSWCPPWPLPGAPLIRGGRSGRLGAGRRMSPACWMTRAGRSPRRRCRRQATEPSSPRRWRPRCRCCRAPPASWRRVPRRSRRHPTTVRRSLTRCCEARPSQGPPFRAIVRGPASHPAPSCRSRPRTSGHVLLYLGTGLRYRPCLAFSHRPPADGDAQVPGDEAVERVVAQQARHDRQELRVTPDAVACAWLARLDGIGDHLRRTKRLDAAALLFLRLLVHGGDEIAVARVLVGGHGGRQFVHDRYPLAPHRSGDGSGLDDDDLYTESADLASKHVAEALQRELRGRVGAVGRKGDPSADRGDVDEASVAAGDQGG